MQIVLSVLMLVVGFVLLVKGADWFVDGAAALAGKLGIPQLVIGLTIVAMGTSLPEAAVSITSALHGSTGITVGNVVGSNIMNILVILGTSAVITNVRIQKSTLKYELPFMLLITVVFLVMGMLGGEFTRLDGVILLGFMIVYLIYLLNLAKKGTEEEEEFKDMPIWKCVVGIVLGAVMIVGGSNLVVDGASDIASAMGISDRIIGLTIVAFGTSLPELVTSVSAAKKGNAGIAIGNIVGSNIFNILFVLGATALICPVPFASQFLIDSLVAIGAGLLLWFGTMKHKELRRPVGIVMLVCYAAYFVYLCMK
ncbi:MAG: calcium/sodium antiporter [Lachnospiraceae bacterium]|nr:calcium/sodium antiporter [Lachnospiraceae bacterium]